MAKVEFNNLSDFELAHIFECGQCFRWRKINENNYIGTTPYGVIEIEKKKDNTICIDGTFTDDGIKESICEYLDLNTDYSNIKAIISKDDINLQKAIQYGGGIRILNQDPWEMLISFIISAANNIPRISKTIENISREYGKEITYKGEKYYLFPTPEELARASVEDLRKLNLGFRDKYVYNAAQMINDKKMNLEEICNMPYKDAKKELKKFAGVGDKVADCILLFSMKKKEAFPVDTWIKKVMANLYNESKDIKKIASFAEDKFGEYAGIAQQYLFYYMRENF
ncbi:MAG: 8-oxoguanine DNA glycosylase [Clostridia bacterium]|nr:8-oxoguanine DNA glycosylase [Clostridia bacterium]